jgi:hypothetical protein
MTENFMDEGAGVEHVKSYGKHRPSFKMGEQK